MAKGSYKGATEIVNERRKERLALEAKRAQDKSKSDKKDKGCK